MKTSGQIAYEAYYEDCGGKSIRGEDLPPWGALPPVIEHHWEVAGSAVWLAAIESKRET